MPEIIQFTIMTMMIINAIIFSQMKHPLSMGVTLLMQTLLGAIYSGLESMTYWFSYILFLIFIGGMLIIFMYMSSLTPNEKMKLSTIIFTIMPIFIMLNLYLIIPNNFITMLNNNMESIILSKISLTEESMMNLSKMYLYPTNLVTVLLMIYLLITLIMVVKMTNSFMGPLRQKN